MSAKFACFTVISLSLLQVCYCARILVLSPLGPRSHIHALMPLVEELANRGHNLTVMTAYTPKTDNPNIRKVVMPEMLEQVDVVWYDFKRHSSLSNVFEVFRFFVKTETVAYHIFVANKNVKEYIEKREVDLVIIDSIANEFTLPFIDYLQVPFVTFDGGSGSTFNTLVQGLSRDYAFIPGWLGDTGTHMTFFQRMSNMLVSEIVIFIRNHYLLSAIDALAQKDFPNSRPSSEIEKNAEICLANFHPATFWGRNLPGTFIPTSAMHVRPPQPLPKDLQAFVEGAEEGFIVFTLGSNSQVSHMPEHLRKAFIRAFSRIPQRVLWKWEAGDISGLSPNVKTVQWLPQQDLLGHEKARLFIAHGGLMGLQEAIYHAVPVLGLPLGRDQHVLLAKASEEEGYAITMDWEDVTEETLYDAIQKIINNPSYKGNVTRLSKIMRDVLVPGREVGAYWIEYLLRHGTAKHLRTRSIDMPFYEVLMLDALAFLLAAALLALVIIVTAFRTLRKKAKKVKEN